MGVPLEHGEWMVIEVEKLSYGDRGSASDQQDGRMTLLTPQAEATGGL